MLPYFHEKKKKNLQTKKDLIKLGTTADDFEELIARLLKHYKETGQMKRQLLIAVSSLRVT